MVKGDAAKVLTVDTEAQLEKEIESLKNDSVVGSFDDPASELCE